MSTDKSRSRVAVIGSGFGGLGMAYYLKQAGIDDFVIFEKAADIGGVWRENSYPGAGCDVPSHLYCFSFEPDYAWTWRFGKRAEILAYMRHCVDKYRIGPHLRFGRELVRADFDATRALWVLQFGDGSVHEANELISAVGQLHRPAYPAIAGREQFTGAQFHSACWDHAYDFAGKTVAVIGGGASAVQFVPEIAKQVMQLQVFQRAPGWVAPKVELPISRLGQWLFDHVPLLRRLDRLRALLSVEFLAYAYNGHAWAERLITGLARRHLHSQVADPDLRSRLTPKFPIGCKRILLSSDWLPALLRPNVEVVTDAIVAITQDSVVTADGRQRRVDAIVYGTGFAATEFLAPMQITGRDGRCLREQWQGGADAYLGISVAGFPNFFMLYGPNTNVGSGSVIYMLESQQRYIVSLLRQRQRRSWSTVEVTAQAQAEYRVEIETRSADTTFAGDCQSWYKTADGRNTNNWVGSMREYRRRTAQPDWSHYQTQPLRSHALPRAA